MGQGHCRPSQYYKIIEKLNIFKTKMSFKENKIIINENTKQGGETDFWLK